MGAIAEGGVQVLNNQVIEHLQIPPSAIVQVAAVEQLELDRRARLYRGDRPAPNIQNRAVILVDDGLATGSTMRAAAVALRSQMPIKLVMAVPVAAADTCAELRDYVDVAVCAATPEPFQAVGIWYEDFSQTSDEEVRELLNRLDANRRRLEETGYATRAP
jgi:predicted phosphoribosyltransferase